MPTEMSNVRDLIEEREREALEELGRLKTDDPNRGKVLAEVKTIAEIRNSYDQTELTRLNNNAKNSIEEEKLVVEQQKVKNDTKRIRAELGKAAMFIAGGFIGNFGSYLLDTCFQKFTPLQRFADKLHEFSMRK